MATNNAPQQTEDGVKVEWLEAKSLPQGTGWPLVMKEIERQLGALSLRTIQEQYGLFGGTVRYWCAMRKLRHAVVHHFSHKLRFVKKEDLLNFLLNAYPDTSNSPMFNEAITKLQQELAG